MFDDVLRERGDCFREDKFDRSTTSGQTCRKFIYRNAERTIINEFDLHCQSNDWKRALVGSVNNIGLFVFLPIMGYLSDRYVFVFEKKQN